MTSAHGRRGRLIVALVLGAVNVLICSVILIRP